MSWFAHHQKRISPHLRLFAFPYAGGGPGLFRKWSSLLPDEIEVFPLQYPGREKRFGETLIRSMPDLVDGIVEAIEPLLEDGIPFAFFGYSMGASVAYEVALKMNTGGGISPVKFIACAGKAPGSRIYSEIIHRQSDEDFMNTLRNYGGVPEALIEHTDYLKFFFPIIRADFAILENYRHNPSRKLGSPLFAYRGEEDHLITKDEVHLWADRTDGDFSFREFPGGHFFISQHEELLVRTLERDLLS